MGTAESVPVDDDDDNDDDGGAGSGATGTISEYGGGGGGGSSNSSHRQIRQRVNRQRRTNALHKPVLHLRVQVRGAPDTGKHTLLQRLQGQDPFRSSSSPEQQQFRPDSIQVPLQVVSPSSSSSSSGHGAKVPQLLWDRIVLHVRIGRDDDHAKTAEYEEQSAEDAPTNAEEPGDDDNDATQRDKEEFHREDDDCILVLLDARRHTQDHVRAQLRQCQKQCQLAGNLVVLLNFWDETMTPTSEAATATTTTTSSLKKKQQQLTTASVHAVVDTLFDNDHKQQVLVLPLSLRNCYGLNVLHAYLTQDVYWRRKRRDLQRHSNQVSDLLASTQHSFVPVPYAEHEQQWNAAMQTSEKGGAGVVSSSSVASINDNDPQPPGNAANEDRADDATSRHHRRRTIMAAKQAASNTISSSAPEPSPHRRRRSDPQQPLTTMPPSTALPAPKTPLNKLPTKKKPHQKASFTGSSRDALEAFLASSGDDDDSGDAPKQRAPVMDRTGYDDIGDSTRNDHDESDDDEFFVDGSSAGTTATKPSTQATSQQSNTNNELRLSSMLKADATPTTARSIPMPPLNQGSTTDASANHSPISPLARHNSDSDESNSLSSPMPKNNGNETSSSPLPLAANKTASPTSSANRKDATLRRHRRGLPKGESTSEADRKQVAASKTPSPPSSPVEPTAHDDVADATVAAAATAYNQLPSLPEHRPVPAGFFDYVDSDNDDDSRRIVAATRARHLVMAHAANRNNDSNDDDIDHVIVCVSPSDHEDERDPENAQMLPAPTTTTTRSEATATALAMPLTQRPADEKNSTSLSSAALAAIQAAQQEFEAPNSKARKKKHKDGTKKHHKKKGKKRDTITTAAAQREEN